MQSLNGQCPNAFGIFFGAASLNDEDENEDEDSDGAAERLFIA